MYSQAQKLFSLREHIFKKLTNKRILNNNSDQSNILKQKHEESIVKKRKITTRIKTKFEESIAQRIKLRKQRFSEIAKREKMISNNLFKEYFEYSSPSDLYKNLNTTTKIEKSKTIVNKIKVALANLMVDIKNNPINNVKKKKNRNRNNMVKIVELILEFNQLDQEGSGLKDLTPSQMLSRLTISLAQLRVGNNSEKLKNEIRQIFDSLYRSKKLTKNVYKSLIDII